MSEQEAYSKLELFASLADLGSNHNIFKTALLSFTNVLEGISQHPRINNYVDLKGLSHEIDIDPQIDALLKETIDQYREEIAENVSCEVKLLSLIGIKGLKVSFFNKQKKAEQNV
jgi:hypothetical protein